MKQKKLICLNFREQVFNRNSHKCKFCGSEENLDAHHITDRSEMPNGGYVKENGITVYKSCNFECELFHMTNNKKCIKDKHPNDLYALINSSKEKAIKASKKLEV